MFFDFEIIKKCSRTNARVSRLELSTALDLPIFMPVGTYGAMRSIPADEIQEQIILANSFHCRKFAGSIKEFANLRMSLLTDSGGFQIQSLPCEIVEDGVKFLTKDFLEEGKTVEEILQGKTVFTPERSTENQIKLGADVIMQLDDVVNPLELYDRHEIAVKRSISWLDRCISVCNEISVGENFHTNNFINDFPKISQEIDCQNEKTKKIKKTSIRPQVLFPIVQGGLYEDLRCLSIKEILKRKPAGLAIGGMCGGESKKDFVRIIHYTILELRKQNFSGPVYTMGVGYPDDIVVIAALGSDMSDCVYPTRTGRFGNILSDQPGGDILVSNKLLKKCKTNSELLQKISCFTKCNCYTCTNFSLLFLLNIKKSSNFCSLISRHNLHYMRTLTNEIRKAILDDRFAEFIKEYFARKYGSSIPEWIKYFYQLLKIE